jgi:hypothetical protein
MQHVYRVENIFVCGPRGPRIGLNCYEIVVGYTPSTQSAEKFPFFHHQTEWPDYTARSPPIEII